MSKYFISYPSSKALNPFIKILNNELKEYAWLECQTENVWMNLSAIIKNRNIIDVLYFHWPETFWRSSHKIISYIKSVLFILHVYLWKKMGYKLVFSAHNIIPHFGKVNFRHERYMRKFIIKKFHLVIGHSYNTYQELTEKIGEPRNYVLALHGLYDNIREPQKRKGSYNKLFISYSDHDYKGVKDFLNLLLSLKKEDRHHIQFLITGNIPEALLDRLSKNGVNYQHIKSKEDNSYFLTEEELEDVISQSDIMVMPYKNITNSGFYFMALTMGKGVLAADLPFFRMHSHPETILLYEYNNAQSLTEQFQKIQNGWYPDSDILKTVRNRFSWKNSAKVIAINFQNIL